MSSIESLVQVDDSLRPQTTFSFKKGWAEKAYDFPNLHIEDTSFPVKSWDPVDTYADDHNIRFVERYYGGASKKEN